MPSPRTNTGTAKPFELGLPSSEDSFTPSETSEKYEDLVNSESNVEESKKNKRNRHRKRKNNSKEDGSDKSSLNSKFSNSSDENSMENFHVTEGVQTDDEYLERLSPKSDSIDDAEEQILIPKRHVLLLMIFLGFVNIYAMRVNLNVAIVAMVNNKTIILPTGDVKKIVSLSKNIEFSFITVA